MATGAAHQFKNILVYSLFYNETANIFLSSKNFNSTN